ncbi:MAG: branched-chain amino acid ABC transporter permease [Dehalococcoidia bacterium]|nr:branched-chain amino acid ABC transporter permease [Dehalococcoidia bacterium]
MQPCGILNQKYAQDMAIVRTKLQWGLWIAFVVLLFLVPLFVAANWLMFLNHLMITMIAVFGLQLLVGFAGQISLMHGATMAVGAYSATMIAGTFALPFWLTIPCGTLAAGVIGLIAGAPSLRIKGFYLALATFAAHYIIIFIISHSPLEITGGTIGLDVPPAAVGSFVFRGDLSWFYLILPITLISGLFAKNLARGKIGRAFVAMRDNDLTAEAVGINLFSYKVLAFFICSLFAGLAGSLQAYYIGFIDTSQFTLWDGIWYLGMIIIGGAGSILGVIFGVVIWRLLEHAILLAGPVLSPILGGTIFPLLNAIFAVLIIVFLIFQPRGLAHRWELFKASYRLWPYSY